jgi:hypothetical protein
MSNQTPETAQKEPKLTDKQKRFVEEYCVDWNGTQAAIRAGYSEETARQIGAQNLSKLNIRAAIDQRMLDLSLSSGQTTKLISDIAQTRLNDFMVVREVQGYALENVLVSELITRLEGEIDYINSFIQREGLKKKDQGPYKKQITKRRTLLLEYQLELDSFGPETRRLVAGRPVLQQVVEMDHIALAQAKAGGLIKAWVPTEHGIKVELYDALGALRDMGRVHGIFEKDNSQAAAVPVLNTKVEIITTGPPIARSEKEVEDV